MNILGLIGGIATSLSSGQSLLGGLGGVLNSLDDTTGVSGDGDTTSGLGALLGSFLGGGNDDASSGLGLLGSVAGLLA